MPDDSLAKPAERKPTLFLSYAHDDRTQAQRLAAALTSAGYELWWDALIEGGAAFASTIGDALDKADAVIVLWSANSVRSDWVCDEAAQGRDAKRLVPLRIDDSLPPLGFRQYQAIDFSRWKGAREAPEMAALERALAALDIAAPRTRADRPAAAMAWSRRSVVLAGTGIVAVGGGVLAWRKGLLGSAALARNSIAVLPLRNLSANTDQAYFSDGLTEELRNALRRVDALQVMAATSSNLVQAAGDDAIGIAGKLKVAYLLEGSVQRAGDVVRIALELVDGATGFSRWSNRLDRQLTDIFAVQSEIAATVAQALSVQLATAAPAPGGTRSVAAYEHYLRGRALFNLAKDEPTDRAALAEYDLAIAADPQFAIAHAARSRSLATIFGEYAKASQMRGLSDEAIRAAERAIAIAPGLAEGQLAMGYILFTGKLDVPQAGPFFDRAAALGHGNADILLLFAIYCSRAGRAGEARAAINRAIALDPLNPRTFRAASSIAFAARRYRDAIDAGSRALRMKPDLGNAHYIVGYSQLLIGDPAAARASFLAEPRANFRLSGLAIAEHRRGDNMAATRAFEQLVRDGGDSALYQQAEVLAQWGNQDGAIAALRQAHVVGDPGLIYLATDPLLDPIRTDPRITALLKGLARP